MLKEEIIVTTHLRNAAGACALSIGLLVCSSAGAIAYADQADSGGAATGTPGGSSTTGDNAPASTDPVTSISNQQDDEENVDGSTAKLTTGLTTNLTDLNTSASESELETKLSSALDEGEEGVGALESEAQDVEVGTAPIVIVETLPTEVVTPAPSVLTPPPPGSNNKPQAATKPAGHDSSPAPKTTSAADGWADLTDREPGPITKAVVFPVADAAVSIARALGQFTFTLVQLPTSQTPITDVLESVSMMIGTVVGAVVDVAQVPNDLATLLGVLPEDAQMPSLIGAGGAVDRAVRIPVDFAPRGVEALQPVQSPVAFAEAPLFGTLVQPSNIGGAASSGLKNDLTLSGLAPVPSGVNPATTSFLDNMVSSVLVPASLTALAAIAVPGVAGLLIVCVAGIRVGYRQAKAGLALRVSGIARFAGPGPMGVVRSGGLIALHTRTPRLGKPHATRAARAKTANAPRLLESVA